MSNTKRDKICPMLLEVKEVFIQGGMVSGRVRGDSGVLTPFCVLICVLVTRACSTVKIYRAEQLFVLLYALFCFSKKLKATLMSNPT